VVYEIDQDHCRHCGREDNGSGMRCEQHVTLPFEREMARARSLSPATQDSFPPVAPCADACPLHLCIQGYAAHVASGEYADALELIQSRLSLPDSVCRVCHRPCESVCIRGTNERPVAINDLKRFVMDWAAEQESPPYEEEREPENGMQVAVVGAGPAGLAAARELWLRGYRVTVFDKNDRPGGLLYTGIPRYRLPREALERDLARIFVDGVRFVGSTSIGKELGIGDLLEDGHDAVFVATGAPRALSLELSGPGKSTDALAYLEAVNLGREVETGSRVVVIGGGNAAIDAARTARRMGANEVTIACLEAREEMPAIADEILEAEGEGVKILGRVQAVEAENGGLRLLPVEPIKERPFGPADFVPVEGAAPTTIAADQLIYAIGQVPDPSVQGRLELDWTEDGSLRVDPSTCRTRHPRVFAGGDLAGAERSVTGAIATGQRAAWGIDRELRGETLADRRMPAPIARRPTDRSPFDRSEHHARELPLEERLGSFREVLRAPTEEEARAEASRCMICGLCGNCSACIDTFGCPAFYRKEGQIRIDPEACTGCGVCADLCPNSAIVARER
ncbi:MAG: FAD-dependent oxidoreductase, partial [Gaiellales bacterium]